MVMVTVVAAGIVNTSLAATMATDPGVFTAAIGSIAAMIYYGTDITNANQVISLSCIVMTISEF